MPPLFLYEKTDLLKVKIKFPFSVEKPEPIIKPQIGVKKLLVLLVSFPDHPNWHSSNSFKHLLFAQNTGSLKDYYEEVSYQKLKIEGEVIGWIRLDRDYSYYVGDSFGIYARYPNNSQGLVVDLAKKIDPFLNFRDFDENEDGYVDNLTIVHAGPGAEETGNKKDMWSHKWELADNALGSPGPYLTNDGVYLNVYTIQPERFKNGTLISIGVFAHEFGHLLGLPDLYDTDYSTSGLGIFCLMAAGAWARKSRQEPYGSSPTHPNTWCKYLLGWLEPDSIQKGWIEKVEQKALPTVSKSPFGLRILENPSGVSDWTFNKKGIGEYFLLENRFQTGFDAALPGSGLLILHIDERQTNNDNEKNPLVGILQADREMGYLLPASDWGKESDLWKNDTLGVNDLTIPSTNFYDRTASGVKISRISGAGEVMYCDVEIKPLFLGKVYAYPNPFIKNDAYSKLIISYTPSDPEKLQNKFPHFTVSIFTLDGQLVKTLSEVPQEIYPERRAAYWNLKNEKNQEVASGLYLYLIELKTEGLKERKRGFITIVK